MANHLLDAEVKLGLLIAAVSLSEKRASSARELATLPAGLTKKESHLAQTLARAAFVRAWVEPQQGKRNLGENSSKLTLKTFAALGIQGLTTRDAVRHYWNAWESTRRPAPKQGQVVALPEDAFPEWGSNTIATKQTKLLRD